MAYETMTYEVILERMMKRVTDNHPNIDTREGSMLYNALSSLFGTARRSRRA